MKLFPSNWADLNYKSGMIEILEFSERKEELRVTRLRYRLGLFLLWNHYLRGRYSVRFKFVYLALTWVSDTNPAKKGVIFANFKLLSNRIFPNCNGALSASPQSFRMR